MSLIQVVRESASIFSHTKHTFHFSSSFHFLPAFHVYHLPRSKASPQILSQVHCLSSIASVQTTLSIDSEMASLLPTTFLSNSLLNYSFLRNIKEVAVRIRRVGFTAIWDEHEDQETIQKKYEDEVISLETRRRRDLVSWIDWSYEVLQRYQAERDEERDQDEDHMDSDDFMAKLRRNNPETDEDQLEVIHDGKRLMMTTYHEGRRKDIECLQEELAQTEKLERQEYVRRRRAIEEKYCPRLSSLRGRNEDNALVSDSAESSLWLPE
ncbi:hypothetical protein V8F06_005950 [Rhypophila decipiens]